MRVLAFNADAFFNEDLYSLCLQRCSITRRDKIKSYHHRSDRNLSLAAACLLDIALIDYGLREASAHFEYTCNDKPYLSMGPHFSISHSGSFAVCAVSDHVVGADIQHYRKVKDSAIRRICTPHEVKQLFDLDEKVREKQFIRLWSIKESVIKWHGSKISNAKEISTRFDPSGKETVFIEQNLSKARLCVHEYMLDDYCLVVCSEQDSTFPELEIIDAEFLRRLFKIN